ncbi:alpha-glycosidase [Paenibacillus senegalensis]|uniref:alpha-glycosidase n=1 Tax=Paenibacillus senegalensis TaxID=1465766 RepID=UPI000288C28B|nr:alpha-glycosidase [Paenibacillus senegalensis]
MNREAIYHGPKNLWAYAYNHDTVRLRVRTQRDDIEEVFIYTGDKYDWEKTALTHPMDKFASDAMFDYWEVAVKPTYRRISYAFQFKSGDETLWMTEDGFSYEEPAPPGGYFDYPYLHPIDSLTPPSWAKEAIFYQIFPERFANGDPGNDPEDVEPWGGKPTESNYFGGDLQGIIDKLDYLAELGINAIYLTPVFHASSNHKYDTKDYKQVDPHFGTNELLAELGEACHQKGIRVMLDAVFNHCGYEFPPFQDVLKHGKKSKYHDWFHVREFPLTVKDGIPTYDTFGFFEHMPKFNTANPEVRKYLLDVAEYWIKEIKLDGWRLDVANEVDHQFWRDFRKVVKEANPDAYIVGEVWNDSIMWLLGDQFDSVMNYPFANQVLDFFAEERMDAQTFANKIGALLVRYPKQANEVIFNLLCSHDTPRALTRCGGDKRKLKLSIVFLLTYMGTPCIFYGDEIGLQGDDDPDCRKCMEWEEKNQDRELFDFYRALIELRKNNRALREGDFRFLQAGEAERTLLYERLDEEKHFLIWMNNTEEEQQLSHPLKTNDWHDALSEEPVPVKDGYMSITLKPFDYRIVCRSL